MSNPTFAALRAAAAAQSDDNVLCALDFAEINATDSIRDGATDAFEALALDSIAFTAPFTESAAVRSWFEAHGYSW